MKPFDVSAVLDPLTDVYPSANVLLGAAKAGDRDARYAISRLWLSEGIPFAFKARPAVYVTAEPKLRVFGRFENASSSYLSLSAVFF